ncbi:unnamed protein product [Linum trigynum]|uniref:RNase H type-1 domain-containing protein n=1 Tax=Linum trigynum TaxID=586398 RepID=A0AAV2E9H1_9ROSI
MIGWQAPTQGWACLNMDGSVMLSQGSAAARGVLRSDEGRFVRCFMVNLGGGSITHAELAGIDYGLRLACSDRLGCNHCFSSR